MSIFFSGVSRGRLHAHARALFIPRLAALGLLWGGLGGQAQALGFAEALNLAEQHSPRISAQRYQIDAASSIQKAAGTLPDPKLSVGIENLPVGGMNRWSLTREPMTMQRLAWMQEMPNRAKRDAQIASASAKVERERAALAVQRLQIRQEMGQAWIQAQAVEQRAQVLNELLAENQRLRDSLPARIAGGAAQASDLLIAQQEALALADRNDDLLRGRAKARAMLRRWVGHRADEALHGVPGPLNHTPEQLRAEVHRHAELAQYPALQAAALSESLEAQAEARGDWSWAIAYSRRGRQWGDMVSFQVTLDLPWQQEQRQTPRIQAKQLELQRLEAEQEDVTRKHLQELDDSAAELVALQRQIERLQASGIPLAQGRTQLALSNYQNAKGDLTAVLTTRAQLMETHWRLIDLQALRDSVIVRLNSLIAD